MVHNAILGLLGASEFIKQGPVQYVDAVLTNIIIGVMIGYFAGPRLESLTKPTRQRLEASLGTVIDTIRTAFGR
jgi:hypothetical protein